MGIYKDAQETNKSRRFAFRATLVSRLLRSVLILLLLVGSRCLVRAVLGQTLSLIAYLVLRCQQTVFTSLTRQKKTGQARSGMINVIQLIFVITSHVR
jgi:hypothetical protein